MAYLLHFCVINIIILITINNHIVHGASEFNNNITTTANNNNNVTTVLTAASKLLPLATVGTNKNQTTVNHSTTKSANNNHHLLFKRESNGIFQSRGWSSHSHESGWQPQHHAVHYYHQQGNNNMDLYSLLGGLSFASLLGATLIFLARRNATGRRRRRRSLFNTIDGDGFEDDTDADDDLNDLTTTGTMTENLHWQDLLQLIKL